MPKVKFLLSLIWARSFHCEGLVWLQRITVTATTFPCCLDGFKVQWKDGWIGSRLSRRASKVADFHWQSPPANGLWFNPVLLPHCSSQRRRLSVVVGSDNSRPNGATTTGGRPLRTHSRHSPQPHSLISLFAQDQCSATYLPDPVPLSCPSQVFL